MRSEGETMTMMPKYTYISLRLGSGGGLSISGPEIKDFQDGKLNNNDKS